MRIRVCACAAICAAAATTAAAQERTPAEVIDIIVRESPQAVAIRAAAEVVRQEQRARLAFPNPSLTYSRETAGFNEFVQLEQLLPAPGVRAALTRAGVAAVAAVEAERDVRLWQLRSDAASAVARLAAEQERLDTMQSIERDIERLVEILRVREREGEGSRFDRVRAEQELADSRQIRVAAAVAVFDARAAIAAMLPATIVAGRITGALFESRAVPDSTALVGRAMSARPELRVLAREAERAGLEAVAARRTRRPAPTLFGGIKRADNSGVRETGAVFGAGVTMPLFDDGAREAARWTAEQARIASERAAIERAIMAEIQRTSEALVLRQAAANDSQPSAASDELMRIAEVAYREGEVGILEWLDAVRTAARVRIRGIDTRLEARLAQIALERAVGEVTWP